MLKSFFKIPLIIVITILVSSFTPLQSQSGIIYKVTSTHWGLKLTYTNEQGNIQQEDVNNSKWEKSFKANAGSFLNISAQSKMHNATIKVDILKNGFVIETAESKGDFVIASASTFLK